MWIHADYSQSFAEKRRASSGLATTNTDLAIPRSRSKGLLKYLKRIGTAGVDCSYDVAGYMLCV